jgi:hypothetical protein
MAWNNDARTLYKNPLLAITAVLHFLLHLITRPRRDALPIKWVSPGA